MALALPVHDETLTLCHAPAPTRLVHVTGSRLSLLHSAPAVLTHVTGQRVTLRSSNVDALVSDDLLTPVFSNVSLTPGETSIECSCDTDRAAVVRYRARLLTGTTYVTTAWEPTPKTTSHRLTIPGLIASQDYMVEIEINATLDPDLGWSAFADGTAGPTVSTNDPAIGG